MSDPKPIAAVPLVTCENEATVVTELVAASVDVWTLVEGFIDQGVTWAPKFVRSILILLVRVALVASVQEVYKRDCCLFVPPSSGQFIVIPKPIPAAAVPVVRIWFSESVLVAVLVAASDPQNVDDATFNWSAAVSATALLVRLNTIVLVRVAVNAIVQRDTIEH